MTRGEVANKEHKEREVYRFDLVPGGTIDPLNQATFEAHTQAAMRWDADAGKFGAGALSQTTEIDPVQDSTEPTGSVSDQSE